MTSASRSSEQYTSSPSVVSSRVAGRRAASRETQSDQQHAAVRQRARMQLQHRRAALGLRRRDHRANPFEVVHIKRTDRIPAGLGRLK